ncbi:MAG: virulence-associated protein E, partial [Gemella haemolysans]|nr:virulence-associated protein E [Gemella haemolysans]
MQANRLLGIAKANHRKATIWQNTDISWLDFVETLKSPVRTQEKYDEFLKMKKSDQDNLKDVGGFTGAKLLDGRRKATNIISRDVVCLDLDNIQPNMTDDILKRVGSLGCTSVVYSTRKHSNYTPRL